MGCMRRLRKHITILEMAKLVGVSPSLYCVYEHERRKPPIEVLDGIGDKLALSFEERNELEKLAENTTYHPPRLIDDPEIISSELVLLIAVRSRSRTLSVWQNRSAFMWNVLGQSIRRMV